MTRVILLGVLSCLLLNGCSSESKPTAPKKTDTSKKTGTPTSTDPAAAGGNAWELTSENTKLDFVGTHVGEKPDPRKGSFTDLSGTVTKDSATSKMTSLSVKIRTESLTTEIGDLTKHLKSADFFDVKQYPEATFESTEIIAGEGDELTIKGNLTLLGQTKEISFPANVTMGDEGVKLKGVFTIDRTEFGMNYGLEKVEKAVALTVTVE